MWKQLHMLQDRGDRGGLDTWIVRMAMTGYTPVETVKWWVQNVRVGLGKYGGVCKRGRKIACPENRMSAVQGEMERTHKGKPSNLC